MNFGEAVFFIFCLVVSYHIGQYRMFSKLTAMTGSRQEPPQVKVNKLVIERDNDVLYLYDYDIGTFVCQACSLEDLANTAMKHKNIKYASVLDVETNSVFAFIDGRVEKRNID